VIGHGPPGAVRERMNRLPSPAGRQGPCPLSRDSRIVVAERVCAVSARVFCAAGRIGHLSGRCPSLPRAVRTKGRCPGGGKRSRPAAGTPECTEPRA
jgi:hypothetical protein